MDKAVKVLLVDDDPVANFLSRAIVEETLSSAIDVAENGQEALKIVNECISNNTCPVFILLDINMPVMNGFEFLEQLSIIKEPERFKVVILSSSSASKDQRLAADHKVIGFITKPLTALKLKPYTDQFIT